MEYRSFEPGLNSAKTYMIRCCHKRYMAKLAVVIQPSAIVQFGLSDSLDTAVHSVRLAKFQHGCPMQAPGL